MSVFGLTPFFTPALGNNLSDALERFAVQGSRTSTASDYNIERLGDNKYRIALVAVGVDEGDIDIEEHGGTLSVRAALPTQPEQVKESDEPDYLYRGIARAGFERHFHLDEHIKVEDAYLDKGLLYINLTREIPDTAKPRKIALAKN